MDRASKAVEDADTKTKKPLFSAFDRSLPVVLDDFVDLEQVTHRTTRLQFSIALCEKRDIIWIEKCDFSIHIFIEMCGGSYAAS